MNFFIFFVELRGGEAIHGLLRAGDGSNCRKELDAWIEREGLREDIVQVQFRGADSKTLCTQQVKLERC